jgi:hypothetical protein
MVELLPLPVGNFVPGPWQTSVEPSPIDQVTVFGVAVTVTETPGTAAVAL